METLLQYTFDFNLRTPDYKSGYLYLKGKEHLGLGRIVGQADGEYEVNFSGNEDAVFLSEKDESIVHLEFEPLSLYKPESHVQEMELALSATELRLAHRFNKLSSLSNSRTRLLPHQIESTYIVANSLRPRFILADEVGLGKTVEAALIMKELIFRKGYKTVLIVTPSPLQVQWKQELKNKFNEDFDIVRKRNFVPGDTHWKKYSKIITSIDFIKNPKYAEEILSKKWDIVIFDEAHRLRRDYHKVTRSYLFAEKISKITECLLLLTATPFRGKLEELYYIMHLVDPNILGSYHSFVNDYIVGNKSDLKEKISKVLLRRRKVEVGGFTKRFAKTVKIELSDSERQFYDETTDYVKREYNLAMNTKNRAIGFVMVVFQKLLDSSVYALLSALSKRKFMLEGRLHRFQGTRNSLEDWDCEETENIEDFIGELDEAAWPDLAGMRRELLTLNRLILLGKNIREDRKSQKLKDTLLKLKREGHKKFIIFTQFRTTQDYLTALLENDFTVTSFHGSLSMEAKEVAILEFKNRTEVLICTEAGGEGRNLQFSNILFNYDLPWSPLKIEQRIGRIHRFGQKDNVYIFNFACKDTVAERVLEVLTNKIRLFEESIGASDALLGTIEDELDFNSSLMKFVTGVKTKVEIEQEIDSRIKVAEAGFKRLDSLVTPKLVDFNLQDYYSFTLDERQYQNTHLEEFILAFDRNYPEISGIDIEPAEKNIYRIRTGKDWKLATFDSELALKDDSLDFLAFGHPIVENAIRYFQELRAGYKRKNISNVRFAGKIYFVFLAHFDFDLKRTEIFYYEFDRSSRRTLKIEKIPEGAVASENVPTSSGKFPAEAELEYALIKTSETLKIDSEKRKDEIHKETVSLFRKEEYKLEKSEEKAIRQLEEKLDRQEAVSKWNPSADRGHVISRTKNEILKTRENFEKELRKIRSGSNIRISLELFQVYCGTD